MSSTRCINALNRAAGRDLTPDELESVFNKINKTARDLAAGRVQSSGGPHNLSSPEGVMRAAAELEAKTLVEEGKRKVRNAHMQVSIVANRTADIDAITKGGLKPVEAVRRLLVNDADGKADTFSLEARTLANTRFLQAKIQDTWLGLGNDFLGFIQNRDKAKLLISEMRGEDTGNPLAKKGAKAWRDMAEEARLYFNEIGAKVGHRDDWGLPQHHAQDRVARAGNSTETAVNQKAWVDDQMKWVGRDNYTEIDGRPMTEPQLRAYLEKAWETIAGNGILKDKPGTHKGSGARSNRGSEERAIHYKDAESMMANWEKYGDKTLPEILMGHVESMAKNISFVEHFGPNPDATYQLLRDQALQAQTKGDFTKTPQAEAAALKVDRLYDYAAGHTLPVANQRIANGFQTVKNLNVAGKLGSAFWASAIGDKVLFEAIGHVNNLPVFQRWYNEIRMLNPANAAERRVLRRHGLMLDYMGQAMHRFGDEMGASSFTGKLANGVMRVSGMSAVNEWRRGAWALTAMDSIGHVVSKKDWSKIGPDDARLLKSYGISDLDWKVWKLAKLDDLGGGNNTALTPEGIGAISDDALKAAHIIGQADGPEVAARVRREAVIKYLGAITSESNIAVLEPGWNDRARMYAGLQRGNIRDEITRSFWQFKAFPIAQFERMLDIGLSRPTMGGKIGFIAVVPVLQTIAGAMMLQVQDLLAGKDPRPMKDWKFIAAAAMKGGSLGLYGDFLYSQSATTRYGTGPLEALAGPTIGAAADIVKFGVQAANNAGTEKDSKSAAKALNIAKGFVPGQNFWMTKWATDHLIFQQAQEMLNPGYLQDMEDRTQKEFGQEWWLPPGNNMGQARAPNWSKAFESNP